MRGKRKRSALPRPLIKNLAEDIRSLMKTSEGRLLVLEIVDEIPQELRGYVIEGLSSFYTREMVDFFYLLKEEYGRELYSLCSRGLEKFQMAGLDITPPCFHQGEFYKAYATRTRHTGQMTVDVAWKDDGGAINVECFFLSFGHDGIHGFFVISQMPGREYDSDRKRRTDMTEISWREACYLIASAYACNEKYLTRPARGKFLYRKYLGQTNDFSQREETRLFAKITPALNPRGLINTFFFAQRCWDHPYIRSVIHPSRLEELMPVINVAFAPHCLLVEGQAVKAESAGGYAMVRAYGVHIKDEQLYRTEYTFDLKRVSRRWLISGFSRDEVKQINENFDDSPFSGQVYCRIYDIEDLDQLFEALEGMDDIREIGELPFGVHLRISDRESDVSSGVFFLSGIKADIIINGDELVVIGQKRDHVNDCDRVLMRARGAVRFISEHITQIITAYTYLSGQYLNFTEMLTNEDEEILFEDGLKFLTARYLFKDRQRILERLAQIPADHYLLGKDYEVYYEYEDGSRRALLAEYVVGSDWVTVSAFGDKELGEARERFEDGLRDALEFEGTEIKCEGVFELITTEVKKQYPDLEESLKTAYLNKWFESRLKPLKGMTPRDAARSIEGKRLLWQMFKDMKRKEKIKKKLGMSSGINLKQYIQKIDNQKEYKF